MKILWVTNVPIGKHSELTGNESVIGGWMVAALEMLQQISTINLCIATTWPVKSIKSIKELNTEYILLPGGLPFKYNHQKKNNIKAWKQLIEYFQPDLIHIHGTEFSLGLSLLKAFPDKKYVISIQGLCHSIAKYYFAGIEKKEMLRNITLRDIIRMDTIFHAKIKFQRRAFLEKKYLNQITDIIGRTNWDFVHCKLINPRINYFFCNETLRSEFYKVEWNIKKIKRHSVFIVHACYPIKGLHMMFKALNILKKDFPDIKVYVAGKDLIHVKSFLQKIKMFGYAKYLKSLIKKYKLEDYLIFTGQLNAEEMAAYYQNSHVFVCPSSIENSPNSLCEAQLIGTPSVASFVGGIPDMITHNETGLLYRFEEFEMLAFYVKCIFNDDNLAVKLSTQGKIVAAKRHNANENTSQLLKIYEQIIS